LDVQHILADIALREDRFLSPKLCDFPGYAGGIEENLGIESGLRVDFLLDLMPVEFAIFCIPLPFLAYHNHKFEARLMIGGCWRSLDRPLRG